MNRIFDISELSEDGKRALEMNIRFALKAMTDEAYRKIHNAYARKLKKTPIMSNHMTKTERRVLIETSAIRFYHPEDRYYMKENGHLYSGNDVRAISPIKVNDILYDAILSDTTAKTWGNKAIEEAITRTMAWDERHKNHK